MSRYGPPPASLFAALDVLTAGTEDVTNTFRQVASECHTKLRATWALRRVMECDGRCTTVPTRSLASSRRPADLRRSVAKPGINRGTRSRTCRRV